MTTALTILAAIGVLSVLTSVAVVALALFLGYRAHQVRRPYRDEHQGA